MSIESLSKTLFGLFLLLFLCNCTDTASPPQEDEISPSKLEKQQIVIEGEVDALPELYFFTLSSKFKSEEVKFDSLQFKIELEEESPIIVQLANASGASIPIFAMPGDHIRLTFKFSDFSMGINSHQFTGSSADENVALSKLNDIFASDKRLYSLPESAFLQKLDSLEDVGKKIISEINNPYFNTHANVFLKYKIGEILQEHPVLAKRKLASASRHQVRYDALLEEQASWLHIYPYVDYLMKQIDTKAGFASVPSVKFEMIDALYKNEAINAFCKYRVIRNEIETAQLIKKLNVTEKEDSGTPTIRSQSNSPINDINDAIAVYKTTSPPTELMDRIEEVYASLIE